MYCTTKIDSWVKKIPPEISLMSSKINLTNDTLIQFKSGEQFKNTNVSDDDTNIVILYVECNTLSTNMTI